jgi:dihydroneopterin aldolase/2-amino-4-hydroxy-6-hydroxymethyldihydropteridine diphosphokinase/dihydropteroate synthase
MSLSSTRYLDTISLRGLSTSAIIGPDAWNRPGKPQPLVLSLYLTIDTTFAASSDNVAHTFSYGQMCKDVDAKIRGKDFQSIDNLSFEIAELANNWPGKTLKIVALAPKALLRVEGGFGKEIVLHRREFNMKEFKGLPWNVESHEWFLVGLKVACVIGVNEHERVERQMVSIDLKALGEDMQDFEFKQIREGNEMWRRLVRRVCEVGQITNLPPVAVSNLLCALQVVEASSFQTLEALAALIATTCLEEFPIPQITVAVEKPSALTFVEGAGVEITRGRRFLQSR